jgi:hypothetical protein
MRQELRRTAQGSAPKFQDRALVALALAAEGEAYVRELRVRRARLPPDRE